MKHLLVTLIILCMLNSCKSLKKDDASGKRYITVKPDPNHDGVYTNINDIREDKAVIPNSVISISGDK